MAETAGFDASGGGAVALAVDEAATNVIEHAYKGATDREVELRFEDRGPDFRVELVDTGADGRPARGAARRPRAST